MQKEKIRFVIFSPNEYFASSRCGATSQVMQIQPATRQSRVGSD
jgi:hypothetical protein